MTINTSVDSQRAFRTPHADGQESLKDLIVRAKCLIVRRNVQLIDHRYRRDRDQKEAVGIRVRIDERANAFSGLGVIERSRAS